MHLLRVQVPAFRILKKVDIEFEKEFTPQVFPLGSLNGGGKSTLLQLIFGLLHCSGIPGRLTYLKNLLESSPSPEESRTLRSFAIFDILDNDQMFQIEYWVCSDNYLRDSLELKSEDNFSFSALVETNIEKDRLSAMREKLTYIKKTYRRFKSIENVKDPKKQETLIIDEVQKYLESPKKIMEIRKLGGTIEEISGLISEDLQELLNSLEIRNSALRRRLSSSSNAKDFFEHLQNIFEKISEELELSVQILEERCDSLSHIVRRILELLEKRKLLHITNFTSIKGGSSQYALLCKVNELDISAVESLLKILSQNVFLAAPSTQVYLFLSREERELLFEKKTGYIEYQMKLEDAKSKLSNFFTYDFIAVGSIIQFFENAKNKDFQEAIETGEYGNHYKQLLSDLNLLLTPKSLNLKTDLSGVTFKMKKENENIELFPEDLSHGELKRVSIYAWLKSKNVENAIVLMDEIENAFHPDWHYQIVSDLEQWAMTNQYILATHSYELCQAVTPSHVKELEPKLLKEIS